MTAPQVLDRPETTFRLMTEEESGRIREIDASQTIGRAWRLVDGQRELVEIQYEDPDFPNGFEDHLARLRDTIRTGGLALGAFRGGKLVGFCTVDRRMFGDTARMVLLDQLFITRECRGQGTGRRLFQAAALVAKGWGADRLYICAGSAEETIAFYLAVGCEEAREIDPVLAASDPRDLQLTFELGSIGDPSIRPISTNL
ncbi:MAG: GNAT family N-acetyltransferase [Clostridiaceae bacterium]|nr:GNAT family N-acetyltransferase [Clostridiaceae bacterium]